MNAPAFISPTRTRVLRVFGGRLDGAEYRIAPGRSLRLGHGLDNDIVLRGTGTKGCRLDLGANENTMSVTLVAGEAHLLGQRLEPGQSIILPPFVPLALGEYSVAVGTADDARWPEAEALARQVAAIAPANASDVATTDVAALPVRSARAEQARTRVASLAQHLPRWMRHPALLLAGSGLLLAVLAIDPIRDYATSDIRDAETARLALSSGGFAGVTVVDDGSASGLVFTGTVTDDAALASLRELVAEDFPGARIDVGTSAALARAADDILAAEGIDAVSRPGGLGMLVIESEYLPADRQRDLTQQLKADLPGLARTRFVLTGTRGPDDLAYFFNSARYGLATFVDGQPGYLVTADGSFWFEGATLPTGHEVVTARSNRITLERDGLVEEILVGAPSFAAAFTPPLTSSQGE